MRTGAIKKWGHVELVYKRHLLYQQSDIIYEPSQNIFRKWNEITRLLEKRKKLKINKIRIIVWMMTHSNNFNQFIFRQLKSFFFSDWKLKINWRNKSFNYSQILKLGESIKLCYLLYCLKLNFHKKVIQ